MENVINALTGSPVLIGVGVLLVLLTVLTVALKLVKVALFLGLVLVAYIGWLHYTGRELPAEVRQAEKQIIRTSQEAGKALKEHADEAGQFVTDQARKVGDKLAPQARPGPITPQATAPTDRPSQPGP
ncbi:MAG: hypothetical protein FJ109_01260 [Deltaproteobacteria bacterium]|nr:hypothetical protein [Deltaproteobacteria bacterium]